jgi:hypothetical protein
MSPKRAKKPLGWPAHVDRADPFLWRFEPPFGLGLLRGINSLAAKIRRRPSTGTRQNLGERDDRRRESLKLSRRWLLTDKRRVHLRSTSIRTYTFFTTGFPRFLSIRGARRLQAFDLPPLTNYSNPNNG